jgi:hypothetical protein
MLDINTLAAWGEFIGGIAVVVLLIYLAGQIRQNSRLLRASTASLTMDAYSGDRERPDRLIVITQIGDRERVRMSLDGVSVSLRLLLPSGRPL